jgi:hypothetical protein
VTCLIVTLRQGNDELVTSVKRICCSSHTRGHRSHYFHVLYVPYRTKANVNTVDFILKTSLVEHLKPTYSILSNLHLEQICPLMQAFENYPQMHDNSNIYSSSIFLCDCPCIYIFYLMESFCSIIDLS